MTNERMFLMIAYNINITSFYNFKEKISTENLLTKEKKKSQIMYNELLYKK